MGYTFPAFVKPATACVPTKSASFRIGLIFGMTVDSTGRRPQVIHDACCNSRFENLPDAEEVIKYDMPGFQIEEQSSRAMPPSANNAVCMSTRAPLLPTPTRSVP
jgi:hypothetical protein